MTKEQVTHVLSIVQKWFPDEMIYRHNQDGQWVLGLVRKELLRAFAGDVVVFSSRKQLADQINLLVAEGEKHLRAMRQLQRDLLEDSAREL